MSVVYPRIAGTIGSAPNYLGSFSWLSKPSASASINGAMVYITDIGGGSYWFCDGTQWKLLSESGILIQNRLINDVTAASSSENVFQIQIIPAGVLRDGNLVSIDFALTKTSLAATSTTRFRFGQSASVPASNVLIGSQSKPAAGDTYIRGAFGIMRSSATTVRVTAAFMTTNFGSHSTPGYGTDITVPDMDQNTNYLMMTHQNASSETITNQMFRVSLK